MTQPSPSKPPERTHASGLYLIGYVLVVIGAAVLYFRPGAAFVSGLFAGVGAGLILVGIVYGRHLELAKQAIETKPGTPTRALGEDANAVSPVIGVILMVAITVVLAAVVWVTVSNLGAVEHMAPAMAFESTQSTSTTASFRLISLDGHFDWGVCLIRDGDGFNHSGTINGDSFNQVTTAARAGDVLTVTNLAPETSYAFHLVCDGIDSLVPVGDAVTRGA